MPLDDAGLTPPPSPTALPPPGGLDLGAPSPASTSSVPDVRGLIDQSRQMGATDDQIRDLMVKAPFLADTWQASEKAGIPPNDVFQHFGISPAPAPALEPPFSSTPGEADAPAWMSQATPPSLEDIRGKIQQADINALNYEKAKLGTGVLGQAVMTGTHLAAGLAELPASALIGMTQGPSGAVTLNPETGTYGLTPEAQAAAQLGATGLRFGGPLSHAETVGAVMRAGNVDEAISTAAAAAERPVPPEEPAATIVVRPGTEAAVPSPLERILNGTIARSQFLINQIKNDDRLTFDQKREQIAAHQQIIADAQESLGAQPQTTGAPPEPQPAGAAVSRDTTAPAEEPLMSTEDMKANRRVAELNRVLAPPEPGDTNIYVKGSYPTLAEYSGEPKLSHYENLLRERVPEQFFGTNGRLTQNNAARVAEYDTNTVPDTVLRTMQKDREAQWIADSKDIIPTAKPVDLQPAWDWVQGELSDPRIQENDAVRGVLEGFKARLKDASGELKTDPGNAWGIHDNLQNQLAMAKDPMNTTGAEAFAEGQLVRAKNLIDEALNIATDNKFQTALDNYAKASQAINAGRLFNEFRDKLTNMTGEIQAQRFHDFVVSQARERGNPGIDPSMDISDEGMQSLMNIDDDLKRAKLIKLGGPAGSQTNLLGSLAETAASTAAKKLLGRIPGVGPMLEVGQEYLTNRKFAADAATHLAPPEGGYKFPEPPEAAGAGLPPPRPLPSRALAPPQPVEQVQEPPQEPVRESAREPVPGQEPGGAANLYRSTVALTPAGNAVPIRYTLREASDLIPSQLPDGRTNPAFPPELQPRDRTRAASVAQITAMANRLQPELLGYAGDTATGAPVVGPDGIVESGNGRTLAIQKAYAEGSPQADSYRKWLADQGFDVGAMREPVLVRERTAPLDMADRARLADEMGASPIMGMSVSERAAADAKRIPSDVLSMYQGGVVTSHQNANFVRAFADNAIPAAERAAFMTADGKLSVEGAARMRNALTQRAYGSNALVTSLAEDADPELNAFGGALIDAAGAMAKVRGAIETGLIDKKNDIADSLIEAVNMIQTAKRQRISLADAVAQRDAFTPQDPLTERILRAVFGDSLNGRMSRVKFSGLLSNFADELQKQSELFGENKPAPQVFDEAALKYGTRKTEK